MKNITKATGFILVLSVTLMFQGCFKDNWIFGIRGAGETVTKEKSLDMFTEVDLGISATVYLYQSDERKVVIDAQENIADNIKFVYRDGKMKIKFDRKVISHDGIIIHLYSPVFNGIEVSGSGDVIASTPIDCSICKMRVSGSGYIELGDLTADEVDLKISGSGEVKINGSVSSDFVETTISGSGSLNAYGFQTNHCDIDISGSGSCKVNVTESLKADISGSGSVYYIGNPSVSTNISGSGEVHHMN